MTHPYVPFSIHGIRFCPFRRLILRLAVRQLAQHPHSRDACCHNFRTSTLNSVLGTSFNGLHKTRQYLTRNLSRVKWSYIYLNLYSEFEENRVDPATVWRMRICRVEIETEIDKLFLVISIRYVFSRKSPGLIYGSFWTSGPFRCFFSGSYGPGYCRWIVFVSLVDCSRSICVIFSFSGGEMNEVDIEEEFWVIIPFQSLTFHFFRWLCSFFWYFQQN